MKQVKLGQRSKIEEKDIINNGMIIRSCLRKTKHSLVDKSKFYINTEAEMLTQLLSIPH